MSKSLPKFSEKELALLYDHTQAPYLFDALVQSPRFDHDNATRLHDLIGHQSPDVALLSLSMCGLIVARDLHYRLSLPDFKEHASIIRPLIAELDHHAHKTLYTLGRLWLDSVVYDLDIDHLTGLHILKDIPADLQVLTSLYAELRDLCDDQDPFRAALNVLYYQAESQSDQAEVFVEAMLHPKRKKIAEPGPIPLPLELSTQITDNDETAKIIPFSVFAQKRSKKSTA